FKPELEILLANSDMAIVDCKEWLTNQDAGFNTCGVSAMRIMNKCNSNFFCHIYLMFLQRK
ncbi:MAG: hypothetical protein ACKPER_21720, partial [Dolichospermum sp.]